MVGGPGDFGRFVPNHFPPVSFQDHHVLRWRRKAMHCDSDADKSVWSGAEWQYLNHKVAEGAVEIDEVFKLFQHHLWAADIGAQSCFAQNAPATQWGSVCPSENGCSLHSHFQPLRDV